MKKTLIGIVCAATLIAATGCAGGKISVAEKGISGSEMGGSGVIDVTVEEISGDKKGYSDDQLVTWAATYYEFCTGEKAPNVAVDHVEGDTVYIIVYEDIEGNEAEGDPGHRMVIEWYIVDRNTGTGKNFSGEDVDLTTFLKRTGMDENV